MSKLQTECTPKCSSKQHALELISAVIRGTTPQIKAYMQECCNFASVRDLAGRNVLHVAASVGKWQIVDWLLEECGSDRGAKDWESGWTALHRAIFYGQISTARILISHGMPLYVHDREGLTAFDLAMKDRLPHVQFSINSLNDVYTWGDNTNFTLGHGNERRKNPELLECFRKGNICIKQVVMCKYHTVFLSTSGQVYTCGHGHGGRLGHGNEQTYLDPKLVEAVKNEVCTEIAAGRDHTVLLMDSGAVYTFGLNDNHQLGQFPLPSKCLIPKQVTHKLLKGRIVLGIKAGRFHTVVYTGDAVFTFGLNAGQLGHPKGEKFQSQPRQVSAFNHKDFIINHVACSDAAICVTTQKDVYVLHEYQCRKIASKWLDIAQIEVSGGQLDHNSDLDVLREKGGNELCIVMRNTGGKLFMWKASVPTLKRLTWSLGRQLCVTDLTLSTHGFAMVTMDGEAFSGLLHKTALPVAKDVSTSKDQTPSSPVESFGGFTLSDIAEKDDYMEIEVKRLPFIHRATKIISDKKGRNFAVLQGAPYASLTEVPSVQPSEMCSQFSVLLDEADEADLIHDVVIQIGQHRFATHKYILSSRSDYFRNILVANVKPQDIGERVTINIDDSADNGLFLQMLKFIYTDTCDLLKIGKTFSVTQSQSQNARDGIDDIHKKSDFIEITKSKKKMSAYEVKKMKEKGGGDGGIDNHSNKDQKQWQPNPVKMFQDMAKKFGVKTLVKRLDGVKYLNGTITASGKDVVKTRLKFDRKKYPALCDVCIQSEDDTFVQCHKCVLVARLEYFHSMLASGWIETSQSESLRLPVPGDILTVILDYLYADESPTVQNCDNPEFLCNILVVADQLLIVRLKEMCEVALTNMVSLRNAAELLEFASLYNATQLKATCQQFIGLNIAAMLESRSLDILSDGVMDELTIYYRQMVPSMSRRFITPYSVGPSCDYLESLENVTGTGNQELNKDDFIIRKAKAKKKRNRTKSTGEDMSLGLSKRDSRVSVCSDVSIDNEEGISETLSVAEKVAPKPLFVKIPPKSPQEAWPQGSTTPPTPGNVNIPGTAWSPRLQNSDPVQDADVSSSKSETLPMREILAEQSEAQKNDVTVKASSKTTPKKISQRERKRQMLQKNENTVENRTSTTDAAVSTRVTCPWGKMNTMVQSFKDLMVSDQKQADTPVDLTPKATKVSGLGAKPKVVSSGGADKSFSWGLPTSRTSSSHGGTASSPASQTPASPLSPSHLNPWQKQVGAEPVDINLNTPTKTVSFSKILQEEIKQKDTFEKVTRKPLTLIQMEEKAIQELLQYYKVDDNFDEHITVERVTDTAAKPVWARHTKH